MVALVGVCFAGIGLWARRDVLRALARERVVIALGADSPSAPVTSAHAARALAEVIRQQTLEAAGGRTYSETDQYLTPDGSTASDSERALKDERTGRPVSNPDYELWIQSTTLQTALMQAYLAFRLADLTAAMGAALIAAGIGLGAAGRR